MNESISNAPHQEMIDAFDQAKATAQADGSHKYFDVTSAGSYRITETVGDSKGSQVSHNVDSSGRQVTEKIMANSGQHGLENALPSATPVYEAKLAWPSQDPSQAKGQVQIRRTNSKGETYSHTFKNPNTARKFGALMAKQAGKRINEQGKQQAA